MRRSSGKYRHRVEFQRDSAASDPAYNVPGSPSWVKVADAWCSISPQRYDESLSREQVQARITHVLECHWFDGIDGTQRVVIRSSSDRVLRIRAVKNQGEMSRTMQVLCTEVEGEAAA